jgi:hypothetical protein
MLAVMVVTVTCATKLMLARASPLKPRVEMVSRSSNVRSLLVVCLRRQGRRERSKINFIGLHDIEGSARAQLQLGAAVAAPACEPAAVLLAEHCVLWVVCCMQAICHQALWYYVAV